jgi:hypothetical protein
VVQGPDRLLLYYAGFQRAVKIPYTILTGVAASADGGRTFRRVARVPALERTDEEAVWRTAAHVIQDGGRFRMWYAGGSEWVELGGKPVPRLHIRHVESADGVTWRGPAMTSLAVDPAGELSLGRPWIVREPDGYLMHYSIRGGATPYRLAAARSPDGRQFAPLDGEPGLAVGPEPWDAEMMYASAVFQRGSRAYLFYNGNSTGQTGFGWAERVSP